MAAQSLPSVQAVMRLLLTVLASGLLTLAGWKHCNAQAAEYQVKAAFLFKFGSYVDWPPMAFSKPDAPIEIGVLGASDVADELSRISTGRAINGHPVSVHRLRRGDPITGMHMLFIGASERERLAALLAPLKGQPSLVVTEVEDALNLGAMINFVVADDKVRFDIALAPAESSNLKISARLLNVARKVLPRTL